jgi:hypothetical protein
LELRGKFDGQDPFMTGGHQIIQPRGGNRVIPEWAKSDVKIQKILLRSFPELKTNPAVRVRAARWMVIIQLYYRMQMTNTAVAAQAKLPIKVTNRLIEYIAKAAKGRRADNGRGKKTGMLTGKPKGRPKNNRVTQTSLGSRKKES